MDRMIEFEPLGKAFDLMRSLNEGVLANENLTAGDVKQYLVNFLEAARVLEGDAPSFLVSDYREANRRLRKSLELWDSDRSECLFHLLHIVVADRVVGEFSSITASSRCAQVLLSEPLVPDREPQKYRSILFSAHRAMLSTLKKEAGSIKADLFLTYASGVQWNAMRYCPQIFDGSIGKEDLMYTRNRFLANLSSLQGLPPYVQ